MQRTKDVKLHDPYRLLRRDQNSFPLRSQISSKSQSSWQMSCLFSSFTLSSSARMSARMAVFFLRLASGASSKVKRETSTLLIFAECNLSALVILVELASATAADLPLGVMNFSSSSSKACPFFLFSEEKQILVCCLYLLGVGARENQRLNESKLQGRGKRLATSSKKYQFLRYPLIRYKFFISSILISPSAASISNKSTMFLYCRHTVLRKVQALSKFWISSSNNWQNFFLREYQSSLLRSGISPSSFRNWQKSSKLRVLLQPHFFRNRSTPLLISSS